MSNEVDLRKQRKVEANLNASTITLQEIGAPNKTVVSIPASITDVSVMPQNALRRELTIHNNTGGIVWVLYGSGATSTNYSQKLNIQDTLHCNDYRGQVNAICQSAIGFLMVTETYY